MHMVMKRNAPKSTTSSPTPSTNCSAIPPLAVRVKGHAGGRPFCACAYAAVNSRRACAARVTLGAHAQRGFWVCVSVCLLSHISPMERLFVLKTLSRTQRATKVKNFVGFSLKPLRCRDPAPPPLYGHAYSRPFLHAYFSCI